MDGRAKFDFGIPDEVNKELTVIDRINFAHSLIESGPGSIKKMCGNNVQYISIPFWEAYSKYRHKLSGIFDKEEIKEGGVLITNVGSYSHTYYYYVETKGKGDNWEYQLMFMDFCKHTSNNHPSLDVLVADTDKTIKSLIWKGYVDE